MAREHYLDRIRVVLTGLVVLHHTAITYGAPGGWYYIEVPASLSLANLPFILFVSVNQAYFMGAFFLIAGYFTPASYDRKGPARFLLDRLLRLGIPWVVYYFLVNPLCDAMVQRRAHGVRLVPAYFFYAGGNGWGSGPLWFALALLLFCLGYVAWRALRRTEPDGETPIPAAWKWLLSALAVGATALLLRQFFPVGQDFLGLQFGYFASYVFLFAVGIVARRRNWFAELTWAKTWPWLLISIVAIPTLMVTALVASRSGQNPDFSGGRSAPAIIYAFWEPLVAWGILATYLVGFRRFGNIRSRVWERLSRIAYAVYCVHAPVLIAMALWLRGWQAAPGAKFGVTGTLSVLGSAAIGAALLRVPGVRRVL